MKSVNAVFVSIAAAVWLLAAGAVFAGSDLVSHSERSRIIAEEHVQLEMQMVHLQTQEHYSAMHPAVIGLRHQISELARLETPQTARRVRRELVKRLRHTQMALETQYIRKQSMYTSQGPEMIGLHSDITFVKHLRRQFAKA